MAFKDKNKRKYLLKDFAVRYLFFVSLVITLQYLLFSAGIFISYYVPVPEKDGCEELERQSKTSRGLEAFCSGDQGL